MSGFWHKCLIGQEQKYDIALPLYQPRINVHSQNKGAQKTRIQQYLELITDFPEPQLKNGAGCITCKGM